MRSFADLFKGREDVYGVYKVAPGTKPDIKGKVQGAAKTVRGNPEPEFEKHLRGEQPLGVVPIRSDNMVRWFAIDVDIYKDANLHRELQQKINDLRLPVLLTRTKSNGAHLWCFLEDWIPASAARNAAKAWLAKLGNPKADIFPRQDTVENDVTAAGNWINLPYFGNTRLGLAKDGETDLTLEEFVELANDSLVARNELRLKMNDAPRQAAPDDEEGSGDLSDAPPCIEHMFKEGIEEGGRNDALLHLTVYAKRAFPDDWQAKTQEWNKEHFTPKLGMSEVAAVMGSAKKTDYQYLCEKSPMNGLCDKANCLKRKFGIGNKIGKDVPVQIERMARHDGDVPVYRVTLFGKEFTLSGTQELMNYNIFRAKAMNVITEYLPPLTAKQWEECWRPAFEAMQIESAPPDIRLADLVRSSLHDWLSLYTVTADNALKANKAYYDKVGKIIYFRPNAFLKSLENKVRIDRNHAWVYLRPDHLIHRQFTLAGVAYDVWGLPLGEDGLWFEPGSPDKKDRKL